MRRKDKPEADEATLDLTPMLDVVFIMLIFFIVTASFVKEAGIEVNKPIAATLEKMPLANILIAISSKSEVWINKRAVDIRAVRAAVERLKAENPKGSVVIQADQDAKHGIVIQVMDQIKLAGFSKVAISARED